jgi:hypothetical protein
MLARQVRAGDATMTPFSIDLLSDDDKVVQRLALEVQRPTGGRWRGSE